MKFWDTSALLPLFVRQARSDTIRKAYESDRTCAVWTFSDIEAYSAFARLHRERAAAAEDLDDAIRRFESAWDSFHEIAATEAVKRRARRALRLHALTAADALQLAAALTLADDRPNEWEFVCCDQRLAEAAEREGFRVVG